MNFRSRSQATDKMYYGVYTAIVAEVGDPQHPGEVRLRFDWFDPQMRTEWCRICNPYAGNGYGVVWHPELDDEVLVAFVQGDMRWPVVLGGLYNGVDAPPTARTAQRDQKLWRTKGGHELLMDDSSGQQRLRLRSNGGHQVDLDDQKQQVVIRSNGGSTITIDDGAASISVQTSGGQSLLLEGGRITLHADDVVIDAAGVKLGGIAAAHQLVLGDLLMATYNLHTHNCTAPGSPSGPPLAPLTAAVLSQVSKTM